MKEIRANTAGDTLLIFEVDAALYEEAEKVLLRQGYSMDEALRLFIEWLIREYNRDAENLSRILHEWTQ